MVGLINVHHFGQKSEARDAIGLDAVKIPLMQYFSPQERMSQATHDMTPAMARRDVIRAGDSRKPLFGHADVN